MASALRKTMVYLGLAENTREHYDDYYEDDAHYEDEQPERSAEVTHLPPRPVAHVVRNPEPTGISRITAIHPRTYNDAKRIGEDFRDGTPVIMNLSDMDDADAKRLVDFAAGLVFGLHGSIERVTAKVFLLSPSTIEVSNEEAPKVAGRVLFNQS
jgi:cell division inhibitor SepF